MKAIAKMEAGVGLHIVEAADPEIHDDSVLVRVVAASICGSDIPAYYWDDPWTMETVKPGQILGHEFAGVVESIGPSVTLFEPGEIVTAECHLFCGTCRTCSTGSSFACPNARLVGYDAPGAFAEYVSLPESHIRSVPAGVSPALASIHDPLGNAAHATSTMNGDSSSVLVIGAGPIGLLSALFAIHDGALKVCMSEQHEFRIGLAKKLGVHETYHIDGSTPLSSLIERSTFDFVIEASGSSAGTQDALDAVRPGGAIALVGLGKAPVTVDLANQVVGAGVTLRGIVGRTETDWMRAAALISSEDGARCQDVITHHILIDDYDHGFDLMRNGNCGKVVMYFDEQELEESRVATC